MIIAPYVELLHLCPLKALTYVELFHECFFPGKLCLNSIYLSLLVKTSLKLNDET